MKISKTTLSLMISSACAGAAAMYFLHPNVSPFTKTDTALIREVIDTLASNGLRDRSADVKQYGFHAAAGLARHEDKYARLMTKEAAANLALLDRGGVGSSGIEWSMRAGRAYVGKIRPGSPAAVAGLLPEDLLLHVAGVDAFHANTALGALEKFPPGASVRLRIWRASEMASKEFTMTLDSNGEPSIAIPSISSASATIKVREFNLALQKQAFELLADSFRETRPKELVLDLRGQLGGRVDIAMGFVGYFVPPGTALGKRRCKGGSVVVMRALVPIDNAVRTESFVPISQWLRQVPLTILVDEHTASAAEVLAGGLQELGRATIDGVRTAGKGVGQSNFLLKGGNELWLTNCQYFLPSDRPIQDIGIAPK